MRERTESDHPGRGMGLQIDAEDGYRWVVNQRGEKNLSESLRSMTLSNDALH